MAIAKRLPPIAETAPDESAAILADLKKRIEALGEGHVMWSRGALTARGTAHLIFVNGVVSREGRPVARSGRLTLAEIADDTFGAVRAYRNMIPGAVELVWRVEPEVTEDGNLYVRLCFEPSMALVADGVWVESRLFLDWRDKPRAQAQTSENEN